MWHSERFYGVILVAVLAVATIYGSALISGSVLTYSTGESMKPTWKYLNIIWGHVPHSEEEILNGSIVSFHFDNRVFVHRVIDIIDTPEGKLFFTWGDNREYCVNGESFRFNDVIAVIDGHIGVW